MCEPIGSGFSFLFAFNFWACSSTAVMLANVPNRNLRYPKSPAVCLSFRKGVVANVFCPDLCMDSVRQTTDQFVVFIRRFSSAVSNSSSPSSYLDGGIILHAESDQVRIARLVCDSITSHKSIYKQERKLRAFYRDLWNLKIAFFKTPIIMETIVNLHPPSKNNV